MGMMRKYVLAFIIVGLVQPLEIKEKKDLFAGTVDSYMKLAEFFLDKKNIDEKGRVAACNYFKTILLPTFKTSIESSINKINDQIEAWKQNKENIEKPPIVIYDVDDTALVKDSKDASSKFLKANPYILKLHNEFFDNGVKAFFITARPMFRRETTEKNLASQGYKGVTIDNIVCISNEGFATASNKAEIGDPSFAADIAQWKETERTELAKKYNIIATFDDEPKNLQGSNVGTPVEVGRIFGSFDEYLNKLIEFSEKLKKDANKEVFEINLPAKDNVEIEEKN